jgi:hypothetical protein
MRPPGYLLDEHLLGPLYRAIQGHNQKPGNDPLVVLRVGDPGAPPRGTDDPDLLRWAERERFILVSCDRQSMAGAFQDHLREGRHSPGLFFLPRRFSIPAIIESLTLAAYAVSDPDEWRDQVVFLPFGAV